MKALVGSEWRGWIGLVVALVVHEGLARWLVSIGVVERLLSPWGGGLAVPMAATVGLFLLRFVVVFGMPGWLLGRVVLHMVERRTSTAKR